MKSFLIIALFPVLLFSCDLLDSRPEDTKIAHSILKKTVKEIDEKFKMENISFAEAGPKGKYVLLGLNFVKYGSISKSEGRKILLECAHILLNNINSDERFHSFQDPYPFTEKNIKLTIFVYDENRRDLYKPDVSFFTLSGGDVYFKYNTPEDEYKLEHETETYKEALEIIKMENTQ